MSLISTEYKELQKQFHEDRADYGVSSGKYVEQIKVLAQQLNTRDILDYGCGKALVARNLPFPIQSYDPAIPQYDRKPEPAELVICTDVLEHIEPACLDEVLADLARLTKKVLFMDVSCTPAKKVLPDGRNAHLIIEGPRFWLPKLMQYFDPHTFQDTGHSFVGTFIPRKEDGDA